MIEDDVSDVFTNIFVEDSPRIPPYCIDQFDQALHGN